jgi:cytochrome c2
MPDFKPEDMLSTQTRVELEPECKNKKMELKKEVEKFIDDPEQLIKYKKNHFKHEKNTTDIDDLIHWAIVK